MNANTVINSCDEMDADIDTQTGKTYEPMQRKQRRPEPRRKGHGGSAGGGMHCRSNKSHTWGTGAGARLADLRAFAGAVTLVIFALLAPASAADVTTDFTWQQVGSIGNAPNPTTGLGRVTTNYKISAYDTTISQYVDFLNGSDAGKQGLYGVYNNSIGKTPSNTTSAISRTGSSGSYTYSLTNSSFATKPVNYVNWFSAARFVNWYANEKSSAASATETGSYTLNGQTTGNIVARNTSAQIFLPSADEWTKAAFYNAAAQNYYLWPTNSNTTPTAVLPAGNDTVTTANSANYRASADLPTDALKMTNVGTYVNTTSTYGLFDMLGNVTQMTDTAGTTATTFRAFGGSYATLTDELNLWNSSNNTGVFRSGAPSATEGLGTATIGFRVAAIAVPEPGNMVAAAMGIGGLIGFQLMKRRKLALARAVG